MGSPRFGKLILVCCVDCRACSWCPPKGHNSGRGQLQHSALGIGDVQGWVGVGMRNPSLQAARFLLQLLKSLELLIACFSILPVFTSIWTPPTSPSLAIPGIRVLHSTKFSEASLAPSTLSGQECGEVGPHTPQPPARLTSHAQPDPVAALIAIVGVAGELHAAEVAATVRQGEALDP